MPDHPPVTMTEAQFADMQFACPYLITPTLQAHLLAWSAVLMTVAADLAVQAPSTPRSDGLAALKQANVWVQQAMAEAYGTRIPPPWITIVEPTPGEAAP